MKRNVMIVTGAAMLLAAARGAAQTAPPPVQIAPPASARYVDAAGGRSLEDAIALALKQEPSLRAARTDVDAAVARRQQAALRANPTATFERRTEPGGTDNQTSVGLQLPLELFRRGARIAVAEREIGVSRYEVADRRLQVGRADAALVELKRIVGLPPEPPLTVRETLEAVVTRQAAAPVQDPADTDAVIRKRPDVLAAEARISAADARIQQSASEGRFDVSLFGTYMRMDAGFPQTGFAPGGGLARVRGLFNYVAGGAMVMIPVLNRGQGAVAAARAERAGAVAARDAAVLQAQSDLASARIEDASAQEAVAQYREGAQRLARQNLDVVSQTFELGRARIFDVLAEQRRYLEVEKSYTDALRAAFEARTRLRLALGDLR